MLKIIVVAVSAFHYATQHFNLTGALYVGIRGAQPVQYSRQGKMLYECGDWLIIYFSIGCKPILAIM